MLVKVTKLPQSLYKMSLQFKPNTTVPGAGHYDPNAGAIKK